MTVAVTGSRGPSLAWELGTIGSQEAQVIKCRQVAQLVTLGGAGTVMMLTRMLSDTCRQPFSNAKACDSR